jgi:hypothetical protein
MNAIYCKKKADRNRSAFSERFKFLLTPATVANGSLVAISVIPFFQIAPGEVLPSVTAPFRC